MKQSAKIAFVLSLLAAFLGCDTRAPVSKGTLTVQKLSPSPGAPLSEDSIIEVDLAYAISDFSGIGYKVTPQVDTTSEGQTHDGDFPNSGYPVLTKPNGTIHFSFPVKYVWKDSETKHPLVVRFYLNQSTGGNWSKAIAQVGPFEYSE